MAVTHINKRFGVDDAKIFPMTADASGGSTTYGTGIDVPGIKAVTLEGPVDIKRLRGDMQLLDVDATLTNITATITYAKDSLDIAAALLGASVADSGTGDAEIATLSLDGTDRLAYFKLEARTPRVDAIAGDSHLVLYKCIATGLPIAGFAEEDYQTMSVACEAFPRLSDNKWLDVIVNETAVAISA